MRKFTMMLSLAAVAGAAAPAIAGAQWDILRRAEERVGTRSGDVYGGVYDRDGRTTTSTSSRVPPGHMPPAGSCRVWIDGVPPGRQPRPTDCRTAEREAYRYGANARVVYGSGTNGRYDDRYDRRDSERTQRVYRRVIDGRECRVTETWQYGRRINTRTACENNGTYGSRVYDDRVYDGRVYSRDDDGDDRGKTKVKKVKVKHNNGKKGRG